jgi:hypothetical protein
MTMQWFGRKRNKNTVNNNNSNSNYIIRIIIIIVFGSPLCPDSDFMISSLPYWLRLGREGVPKLSPDILGINNDAYFRLLKIADMVTTRNLKVMLENFQKMERKLKPKTVKIICWSNIIIILSLFYPLDRRRILRRNVGARILPGTYFQCRIPIPTCPQWISCFTCRPSKPQAETFSKPIDEHQ